MERRRASQDHGGLESDHTGLVTMLKGSETACRPTYKVYREWKRPVAASPSLDLIHGRWELLRCCLHGIDAVEHARACADSYRRSGNTVYGRVLALDPDGRVLKS